MSTEKDAYQLLGQGEYNLAKSIYEELRGRQELSIGSAINLAIIYRLENYHDEAIQALESFIPAKELQGDLFTNIAISYAALGNNKMAFKYFNEAHEANPHSADFAFNLGKHLLMMTSIDDAIRLLLLCISIDPARNDAKIELAKAYTHHCLYDEAIKFLTTEIQINPNICIYHLNLAISYEKINKNYCSLQSYEAALNLALEAVDYDTIIAVAKGFACLGHSERALILLEKAQRLTRQYDTSIYSCLWSTTHLIPPKIFLDFVAATPWQSKLQADIALRKYNQFKAISEESALLFWDSAQSILSQKVNLFLQSKILKDQMRLDESLVSISHLISLDPEDLDAQFFKANVLMDTGNYEQALGIFQEIFSIQPLNADVCLNIGACYKYLDLSDQAVASFQQCLTINPNYINALFNLLCYPSLNAETTAEILAAAEKMINSLLDIRSANEMQPAQLRFLVAYYQFYILNWGFVSPSHHYIIKDFPLEIRNLLGFVCLPSVYNNIDEIQHSRGCFEKAMSQLEALLENSFTHESIWQFLVSLDNFYLAYQQLDDIDLQKRYSKCLQGFTTTSIVDQLWTSPSGETTAKGTNASLDDFTRRKIAFVSQSLYDHNGSRWALGWADTLLESGRYDVYSFHLGIHADSVTEQWRSRTMYYQLPLDLTHESYMKAAQFIKSQGIDLLIYTDIGMGPGTKILSSIRLATIQATAWGHPITSGSDVVDYYFSSDLMEAIGSERFYSESLIRLANTGLVYPKPCHPLDESLRSRLGFDDHDRLIMSGQSVFKYHPRYDSIYVKIAQKCPGSKIIFIGKTNEAMRLKARLAKSFQACSLEIDNHVIFLEKLSKPDFANLYAISEFALDTPGWSGGNTSFSAFCLHCPVITMPGETMRSRHTYAMLKLMGIPGLIAQNENDFVELAAKLYQDKSLQNRLRLMIACTNALLFDNNEAKISFLSTIDRIFAYSFNLCKTTYRL